MSAERPGDDLQHAAQAAKDTARGAIDDAADSVRTSLERQKDGAAGTLDDFAAALRRAAEDGDGSAPAAGMANWTAERLHDFSMRLRDRDLRSILREAESFARSQPVTFFITAAAVGFLATRFLRMAPAEGNGSTPSTRL
jgi:hypothetical protein